MVTSRTMAGLEKTGPEKTGPKNNGFKTRGLVLRAKRDGSIRMIRECKNTLTDRKRAVFLNHVAATCNVRYSAEMVGVATTVLYAARRREPEFAEQWRAAIHMGYDRLEALMVERALNPLRLPVGSGEGGAPPPADALDIDPELAFRLLTMHRKYVTGQMRGAGPKLRRATEDETDAAILKKLRVLRTRLANETVANETVANEAVTNDRP